MRIACDLDGVLFDSLPTWLNAYNLRCDGNDKIRIEDIHDYGFAQFVKFPKLFFKSLELGEVFRKAPLMPGAWLGVRELMRLHDVYFVTYSHEDCLDGHRQKLDAMRHWLPEVPESRVVFTKHKWLIDADVLVEDSPENIERWLAERPEGHAFCVSHPYNASFVHPRCSRVASVLEVAGLLRKLAA